MLDPEGNVSLYDTVGVDAFFGPYLRAAARYSEQVPGKDAPGRGTWTLYGGLTLESPLFAQLPFEIIGRRPSARIPFPAITREWTITDGKLPPPS